MSGNAKKNFKHYAPVHPFNVGACQAWLEAEAAKGHFLKYFHSLRCVFSQGEPASVRYRLEPAKRWSSYADQEHQEAYRAMGWEYVCTTMGLFHIWRCGDPGVPEFYDDPQVQAEAYRRLNRWTWISDLAALAALALGIYFYATIWGGLEGLVSDFTLDLKRFPLKVCWWLMLLTGVVTAACWDIDLHRFVRQLRRGIPQDNNRPYRLKQALSGWCTAVWVSMVVSLLVTWIPLKAVPTTLWPLADLSVAPPYVAMEVLCPEDQPEPSEGRDDPWGPNEWRDRVRAAPMGSLLTTDQWETEEQQWKEELGDIRCVTRYYRLRWAFLAKPLARGFLSKTDPEELSVPGAEGVLFGVDQEGAARLALWRENLVITVQYTGRGDLREHLEAYAALLDW